MSAHSERPAPGESVNKFYEPEYRQAAHCGKWKAVRLHRGAPLALYDLSLDGAEQRDLASEYPDVVQRFEDYLQSAHVPSAEYPDPT